MRRLLLMAAFAVLLFAACDEDEADLIDVQAGAIDATTEMAFGGTVYKPDEAVPRAEVPEGDLRPIGTAEQISVPYEGEVPVYQLSPDEDEVYTPAITVEPRGSDEDIWVRWLPAEEFEAIDDG